MTNTIRHFAINADDLPRAQSFYAKVFGWSFDPWGPPDFYKIRTGDDDQSGLIGAMQKRRQFAQGEAMQGFECTIRVEDVDQVAREVVANGGEILMKKTNIPGVGELIFFRDTEGNVAGAMCYDEAAVDIPKS